MKAVVKTAVGPGNVELLEVPEPNPRPGEVKIEVEFAGICGTDLHIYQGRFPHSVPVVLGHEFSGVVVEVADGAGRVRVGDRVAILNSVAVTCGRCRFCRTGNYMFCGGRLGMGHGVDGGFRKFCCAREDMVYVLPDEVSLESGALLEPLAACVHAAIEVAGISPGDTVLVSGPGSIGLLCLALAKLQGATVIAAGTSKDRQRLSVAASLDADVTVDVENEDLAQRVARLSAGYGVDTSIECSGSGEAVADCMRNTRKMGTIVQVGIPMGPVTVPLDLVIHKQLSILGSVGHVRESWERALRLLQSGALDLGKIITHKLPLDRWEEAFRLVDESLGIKVLLTPE